MSSGHANPKARTWLITGASSGLGYALAEFVLQRGERVVLAARSMDSMSGLSARYPDTALAVGLDVTQPQQRIAAVEQAQAHFGGIDVLVNNAGIDFSAPLRSSARRTIERSSRSTSSVPSPCSVSSCQACVVGNPGRS